MSRTSLLLFVATLLLASLLGSAWGQTADLGFIEIHGNGIDGAAVFLSDQLKGHITNGTLVIPNVYPGTYTLTVQLKPYFPQQAQVTVSAGRGVAVTFGAAKVAINETAQQAASISGDLQPTSASVLLTCLPMQCSLEIKPGPDTQAPLDLGNQPYNKAFGQDALLVKGLPQGDYVFSVTSPATSQTLSATHGICNDEQLSVSADFISKPGGLSFGTSSYPNCPALPLKSTKP